MFSNGTEASNWMENNCERCWKYSADKPIDKSICKIEVEISMGFIGGNFSPRVKKITKNKDCPYRQEKRQYKKKNSAMTLFTEGD